MTIQLNYPEMIEFVELTRIHLLLIVDIFNGYEYYYLIALLDGF